MNTTRYKQLFEASLKRLKESPLEGDTLVMCEFSLRMAIELADAFPEAEVGINDDDEGDNLQNCQNCGDYTTTRLCGRCEYQDMVDNFS
jgi:hypothetical protein